ncbi:MAG: fibronectin type III domain-containing protein [Acidobacteria bacterium]|nr:fibronectin type III domain-containing protein [Acidobacteriota bacterium]MCA1648875.1 fibronectin type III domain-containing protein [Acidobacteriota bacterium]
MAVPLLVMGLAAGCGKKGAPLAPLHVVPAAVSGVSVRRLGPSVHIRFVLPTRNAGGQGQIDLDRVEIYAIDLAPGGPTPPNRDLLTKARVVGTVPVRPPASEGESTPGATPDTRPGPGDTATFTEELTAESMKAAVRIYVLRGVARSGRPGEVSPRIGVPLGPAPPPPTGVAARSTESAVILEWTVPAVEGGAAPPAFNVYNAADPLTPLNPAPVPAGTYEHAGVTVGTEQCFTLRLVTTVAGVAIESDPSAPACVTAADIFPPAAPKGLEVVAGSGVINLIWDANAETDLAGYVVLRGESPGDTLQALTPAPIVETTYSDTAISPGVRYVYAIVAVDKATPPNASPQSARQEATAR